ncbi:substrate-binding periplasmic protein [Litoribacillus peritrichatus]|uniref:ABC transporter substrate-binding protein n=1 Tax=Litoribacillus peritrichatus TaxID=718191 RepID=A0ABP7N4G0_9GAMM
MRTFLCLVLILGHSLVMAQEPKQLKIEREFIKSMTIVAPVWKNFTNEDGSGLYWSVVKEIFEPVGVKVETKSVPWNRAMKMVSKYRVYNAIAGETLKTEEALIFPDYPIDVEYLAVLTKSNKRNAFKGYQSFKGKTVGWLKDYELIDKDKRNFTLKEYRNIDQGIQYLIAGKIDFLIDEPDVVDEGVKKNGLSPVDFQVAQMPDGTEIFVGFRVDQISEELIKIYNERVPVLVKSGRMEAIYNRWGLSNMPTSLKGQD